MPNLVVDAPNREIKQRKRRNKKRKATVLDSLIGGKRPAVFSEKSAEKTAEELALEDAVFGGDDFKKIEELSKMFGSEAATVRIVDQQDEEQDDQTDELFVIDTIGDRVDHSDDESDSPPQEAEPAWKDSDEFQMDISSVKRLRKLRKHEAEIEVSNEEYELRLRQQFEKTYGKPEWATVKEEESFAGGLFTSSKSVVEQKIPDLKPDLISVVRVADGNCQEYNKSVVSNVEWHPNLPIMLTTGYDKTLRIFHIDGKSNTKLQSVHFKDLPIAKARFTGDGKEIILSGKRKYFYHYDLETGTVERVSKILGREEKSLESFVVSPREDVIAFSGKSGSIILVSSRSRQWIGDLKMNGTVNTMSFSRDGKFLYSLGSMISLDLTLQTMPKFINGTWTQGSALTSFLMRERSSQAAWMYLPKATGSQLGVVNVYTGESLRASTTPKPHKALMNLTTAINEVRFNHDSQIMGMSSHVKRDQFRLVHIPSLTAFQNWPTQKTPLGYVNCFSFSHNSQYLSIGNDAGKVLLYQLKHYL